jgi:methionyl-tRNA synthetase
MSSGTDEYGTATETKAISEGLTPQQICDKYHVLHKNIYDWFQIDFDHFGRTTTQQQTAIAQDIFNNIDKNNYLLTDMVEQLYCTKDERFLADRFVVGQCPHKDCNYEKAKGDQCDKCGRLLDAKELVNPRCILCHNTPIIKSSQHLFLDLGKLQHEKLNEWVNAQQVKGQWTENSKAITKAWLDQGLKPRCITRDLKWYINIPHAVIKLFAHTILTVKCLFVCFSCRGTPVPKEGFEDKVFYVWFDAPIGYISITANYTEQWEEWWKNPEQVQLFQFMGKDNVAFHSVIFPASLIATKQPWTLLHHINTTEYLNYESSKFSKSAGTGVFGDDAMNSGIPAEIWRYYMLINRPEQSDTVFLWEDIAAKCNADLVNNIGNFIQRTLSFIKSKLNGIVPGIQGELISCDKELLGEINSLYGEFLDNMERANLREGLRLVLRISERGNKFVQDTQPWGLFKTNKSRCFTCITINANIIALLAMLLQPFIPSVSSKIQQQINWKILEGDLNEKKDNSLFTQLLPSGHRIGEPSPLFSRLEDKSVAYYKEKYSGQQETKQGTPFPLDIKLGKITAAIDHEDNEKLLICSVNVGEEKERTIVANVKPHYSAQQVIGKHVAVLVNIKPAKFKGIESNGMIFTAVKGKIYLLTIDPNSSSSIQLGSSIAPEGCLIAAKPNFDLRTELKKLNLETDSSGRVKYGSAVWLVVNSSIEILVDSNSPVLAAKIQ